MLLPHPCRDEAPQSSSLGPLPTALTYLSTASFQLFPQPTAPPTPQGKTSLVKVEKSISHILAGTETRKEFGSPAPATSISLSVVL